MNAETSSWQAFNMTAEALRSVDQYVASPDKNLVFLNEAKQKLRSAIEIDPGFVRARYFAAVVEDMLGHPKAAAEALEKLIADNPDFGIEAYYGLAISKFHFYEKKEVSEAIVDFEKVRAAVQNDLLGLLSLAGEIRAYGMMVLHAVRAKDSKLAQENFKRASDLFDELVSKLAKQKGLSSKDSKEIRWRALNGRGVGRMFLSDMSDTDVRGAELQKALKDFNEAQNLSPNNWEILCNAGSAHMRLGSVARQQSDFTRSWNEFSQSLKLLRQVTDSVRPNYGFALWEIGRSLRLQERFAEAEEYFEKARAVPEVDRNVSDKSVDTEIRAARLQSTELYPPK